MKEHSSHRHVSEADLFAHLRGELDAATVATVAHHLLACTACASECVNLQQAGAVLTSFRESEVDFPEFRLTAVRTRVMAEIRRQPRPAAHHFALPRLAWAAAAAVAVIAVSIGLRPPVAVQQVANPPAVAGDALEAAVALVTTNTPQGIALKWQGDRPTYLVLKTRRAGDFRDAEVEVEVEVVCGNSWTDTNRAAGLTYYQVVPAKEPCRS